jgi:hypothetical protein
MANLKSTPTTRRSLMAGCIVATAAFAVPATALASCELSTG